MNKLILILLALMPVISQAEGMSSSGTLDQSKERSKGVNHSQKSGVAAQNQNSQSIDLNGLSILNNEFIRRYETNRFQQEMPRVQQVFAQCLPFTGVISEYPTLNSAPSNSGRVGTDITDIVPRRLATHFNAGGVDNWGHSGTKDGGSQETYDIDPNNRVFSQYARCRIIASAWLDAVITRVGEHARSEQEARNHIKSVFAEMDNDDQLFEGIRLDSQKLWSHANCSPTLERWPDFKKPQIYCGVFTIDGSNITVAGQNTLSDSSIAGRSFKISISSSDSDTVAIDDTISTDKREGTSQRQSGTIIIKSKAGK